MSDIYLSLTETPTVVTLSQPVVSGVLSSNVTVTNVVSVNVVTMPAITVQAAAPAVTTVAGTVAVSNFPSVTTVAGTVALDANSLSALENVTVTVGAAVSVSNFPSTQTIAGTVTANVGGIASGVTIPVRLFAEKEGEASSGQDTLVLCDSGGQLLVNAKSGGASVLGYDGNAFVSVKQVAGSSVTIGSLPSISGTVTANAGGDFGGAIEIVNDISNVSHKIAVQLYDDNGGAIGVSSNPLPISGTVTANVVGTRAFVDSNAVTVSGFLTVGGWDDVNSQHAPIPLTDGGTGIRIGFDDANGAPLQVTNHPSLPLSATVTIGSVPNGSLTTRFGTPTTANTVFATSAVTNGQRKYLLIQNVTTGSNVITVGIGFTPTTTRGIQLTAGAGITFESSYIPTGAVYVLSSVTASNFTILEA